MATPAHPSLEGLPPEMRRRVMSMMDLDQLNALVHASPVYHAQYLTDRRFLLQAALNSTLGCVAPEAWAIHRATSADSLGPLTPTMLIAEYREIRSWPKFSLADAEKLSEDDIVAMASFCSAIRSLSDIYAGCAWDEMAKIDGVERDYAPLSRSEEIRLMRAFYRLQLHGLAFGPGLPSNRDPCYWPFPFAEPEFCRLFEPWEVDEIAGVYVFVRSQYQEIFEEVAAAMHRETNVSPEPFWRPEGNMEEYVTHGLQRLHLALSRGHDRDYLMSTVRAQIGAWRRSASATPCRRDSSTWRDASTWRDFLIRLFRHRPPFLGEPVRRRNPAAFAGDDGLDAHPQRPPLAWVQLFPARYRVNAEAKRDLCFWGYAVWDAARLRRSGASTMMARMAVRDG